MIPSEHDAAMQRGGGVGFSPIGRARPSFTIPAQEQGIGSSPALFSVSALRGLGAER